MTIAQMARAQRVVLVDGLPIGSRCIDRDLDARSRRQERESPDLQQPSDLSRKGIAAARGVIRNNPPELGGVRVTFWDVSSLQAWGKKWITLRHCVHAGPFASPFLSPPSAHKKRLGDGANRRGK